MTRLRIFFFLLTAVVVGIVSFAVLLYAKGYRFNKQSQTITAHGLLVLKSDPDSAQVLIDGQIKTATNTTIPLEPNSYDVEVKKEGFQTWSKRLTIKDGEVTEITAHLFKIAPSLTPITFNGAVNPVISNDSAKIVYAVPEIANDNDHNSKLAGLYILENVDLPIGFSREPRRITDADTKGSFWMWSPDDKEILLINSKGAYILDAGSFTSQSTIQNILPNIDLKISEWIKEYQKRFTYEIQSLPPALTNLLEERSKRVIFSPDNDMILYTASSAAQLASGLIKPIPGSSTQKEDRDIKVGKTYIYDIEEDKNFLLYDKGDTLITQNINDYRKLEEIADKAKKPLSEILTLWDKYSSSLNTRLTWFPTSRHIVFTEIGKITIMDYDGTNRKEVYTGSFTAPYVFPTLSLNRLIILTNLGGTSSTPNLYSLSIK